MKTDKELDKLIRRVGEKLDFFNIRSVNYQIVKKELEEVVIQSHKLGAEGENKRVIKKLKMKKLWKLINPPYGDSNKSEKLEGWNEAVEVFNKQLANLSNKENKLRVDSPIVKD